MGWHRPDEDTRADRYRDEIKHDPRPTDPLTALSVAIAVKGMKNLNEAALLIDIYADTKAAGERLDAVRAGAGR